MGVFAKGMDTKAIEASANQFTHFKSELDQIASDVSSTVSTIDTNWDGNDSKQFVSDWNHSKVQVTAAADTLGKLGQHLKSNAQSQEQASA